MVRRILFCFLVLLLPAAILFGGTVGKISGTVTDQETGEPLSGVNILIEGTEYGAATDAQGYFSILRISPGEYSVRASFIGYKEYVVKNVRVHSDLTTELDFKLERTVLEGEVVTVTAKRKLFEKSATSSISITTVEDLENIPTRGTLNILSTMAGVIVQDNQVHIRGAREDEVGYYINGASTTNPMTNANSLTPIQEAIEEIQVYAGGYTADMGGANAGVVKTELRIGGQKLKGSLDIRADGFSDPTEGKKFLDTHTYGHQLGVATLSGPLFSPKVRFFTAYEYNNMEDAEVRFSKGFTFENLVDQNVNNAVHDTVTLSYPDGFTPRQEDKIQKFNGTLTFDLPIKINLGILYTKRRYTADATPMLSLLNDRYHYYDQNTMLFTGKATKVFSSDTYLDLKVNYYTYHREFGDSYFGNDWHSYYDSTKVAEHTDGEVIYRNAWRPWYSYVIDGFTFERNGSPYNLYHNRKQNYFGVASDFVTQMGRSHQVKTGFDFRAYTIRSFSISPSVMIYSAENGTVPGYNTYGSIEDIPVDTWMINGAVRAYGYDVYGKEIDDSKHYYDDDGNSLGYVDAPKKPKTLGAYIMDKIEYRDLIVNAGLRLDYFDSDDRTLKDPSNPDVDPNSSTLAESAWKDIDPYVILSPRIGLSFPVTDRTAFYMQYGKFAQMPSYDQIYFTSFTYARQIVRQGYYFLNPVGYGLEPEKTTSYEVGFRQQVSENAAFDVTAFYKNIRGLIQVAYISPSSDATIPGRYAAYVNGDFATTKGLEFRLTLRRSRRLSTQINYTLTNAEGTQSNSNSSYGALYLNTATPTTINPLDYSPTHTGSVNMDYRFGKNDGGILQQSGLNLLFSFTSGHPYTHVTVPAGGQSDPYTAGVDYMYDTRARVAAEPLGSSTTPWTFNTDLKLDKSFDIAKVRCTAYLIVTNLFNRKNVINVYEKTGSASDDGFLSDADISAATVANNGGREYIDLYRAINLENGQAYWDEVGKQLYSHPRQIFFGVKFSF